jgi:hypothetical protein
MNKYEYLKRDLEQGGFGTMKCFGNSMTPILKNATINIYRKQDNYNIGDIVFAKVNGRWIDAHLITKKDEDGRYMISNNHGHDNGWTKQVYGKVIKATDNHGKIKEFK